MRKLLVNKNQRGFMLVIAFIILISSISFNQVTAIAMDPYDTMREKMFNYFTGGTGFDLDDPDIYKLVTDINDEGYDVWSSMDKSENRTYLWDEQQNLGTNVIHVKQSYSNLYKMARAYRTYSAELSGNTELRDDIMEALEWIYTNYWNENSEFNGNWHDYEFVIPEILCKIITLLYEDIPQEKTQGVYDLKDFTRTMDYFRKDPIYYVTWPNSILTGSNRAYACYIGVMQGILEKDSAKIIASKAGLEECYRYVEEGEGMHADGSFIQHGAIEYTFVYAKTATQCIMDSVSFLHGSPFEITHPNVDNIAEWIYKCFEPKMFNGYGGVNFTGRMGVGVEQPYDTKIIGLTAYYAQSVSQADKDAFTGFVKEWLSSPYFQPLSNKVYQREGLTKTLLIKEMLDSDVPARGPVNRLSFYEKTDRVVRETPDYGFVLSMYSDRIQNFESINNENTFGWHMGSGMTELYSFTDPYKYYDGYYATVDYLRLPGNTVLKGVKAYTPKVNRAEKDAYVDSENPDFNYGKEEKLLIQNSSSGTKEAYIYFPVDQYSSKGKSKIRLYGSNIGDSSTVTVACEMITDTSWNQSQINYNNAPVSEGTLISTVEVGPTEQYYEIDVTNAVKEGTFPGKVGFRLSVQGKEGNQLISFRSIEAESNQPQLYMEIVDSKNLSPYSWVGGSKISDKYATAGMQYKQHGQELYAKKSWFIFDDEVVAIGSDIDSTEGITTETIIDNVKLNSNGDNTIRVNGETQSQNLGTEYEYTDTNKFYIEGNSGAATGYYFPKRATVKALKDQRTGTFKNISYPYCSNTSYTNYFETIWFDHGKNPTDASYQYVLLPEYTSSEVDTYAKSPEIQIIENSADAHAVRETDLGITGINFWNDTTKTVDVITSHHQASVMYKEENGELEVSISDPTQKNKEHIDIEINRPVVGVISSDPNITVYEIGDVTKLAVYTYKGYGKTFNIKLEIDPKLFLHWKLDGNTEDSSGNNRIGTLSGTASWVTGHCNQGLETNGMDKRMQHDMPQTTLNQFTVAIWVRSGADGQLDNTGVFNNNSSGSDFQIDMDGKNNFRYNGNGATKTKFGAAPLNQWVHLAVVCDGVDTHLYYNGTKVATLDGIANTDFGKIDLGVNRGNSKFFKGTLDELRVYDKSLTEDEVASLAEVLVNAVPQANDDSYTVGNGQVLSITSVNGVLANDTDADQGDTLTTLLVSNPSNGSLSFNSDGSFDYTSNGDFSGVDTFSYKVSDGKDDSALATVSIMVEPPIQVDPDPEVDPNLYLYWELDGNTDDSSGNNRIGVLSGKENWVAGYNNGGLEFNGIDNRLKYDMNTTTIDQFTVSLWVYSGADGQPDNTGVFNNNSNGSDFQIDMDGKNNYRYNGNGATKTKFGAAPLNQWVHLAVVCDGVDTHLYYNGAKVATLDGIANTDFGKIDLGVNRGNSKFFKGTLDELKIFDKALTDTEVTELFNLNPIK